MKQLPTLVPPKDGEVMLLYVEATPKVVSAVPGGRALGREICEVAPGLFHK